jgi:Domain of unknown function (DUF4279)
MATIARASAALRIMGDTLVPNEITAMLGATPTSGQCKGEKLLGKSGVTRIARSGMWRLEASDRAPADLDAQVQEILAKVSPDTTVWRNIASEFDIDLFCGWFLDERNEGLGISASTLSELGARGIELSLDIYAGDNDA